MREKHIEIKVGLLVLIAAALFVGFVFVLGEFETGERVELRADFSTSADLKEGAPVKVSGVTIGKVSQVAFWGGKRDEQSGRRVQVRVHMDLDAAMSQAIRSDANAYITTLGILGEKYVEIEPGSFELPPLDPAVVILGEDPLRLELVARDLSATLREVSALLRENREQIRDTIEHLDELLVEATGLIQDNREAVTKLLASLQSTVGEAEKVLAAAANGLEGGEAIKQALENVRNATEKLDRSVDPVVRRVERTLVAVEDAANSIRELSDENRERVAALLDRVLGVMGDVKEVAVAIREGRGSVGALLADQELYTRIKETIADLQRHPWKFIWKE